MQITLRVKKLENKLMKSREHWGVFNVTGFDDPKKLELEQKRLVDQYIAAGNPYPTLRLFIKDVPR